MMGEYSPSMMEAAVFPGWETTVLVIRVTLIDKKGKHFLAKLFSLVHKWIFKCQKVKLFSQQNVNLWPSVIYDTTIVDHLAIRSIHTHKAICRHM